MEQNHNTMISSMTENTQAINFLTKSETVQVLKELRQEFYDTFVDMDDSALIRLIDDTVTVDTVLQLLETWVDGIPENNTTDNQKGILQGSMFYGCLLISLFDKTLKTFERDEIIPVLVEYRTMKKKEKFLRTEIAKNVRVAKENPDSFISKIRANTVHKLVSHESQQNTVSKEQIMLIPQNDIDSEKHKIKETKSELKTESKLVQNHQDFEDQNVQYPPKSSPENIINLKQTTNDNQSEKKTVPQKPKWSKLRRFCAFLVRPLSACFSRAFKY